MSMMFEDREAYRVAEQKAAGDLARLDPAEVASSRGVLYDERVGSFTVPFLGEELEVTFPGGAVLGGGRAITGAVAVLALHYLVYRGEPLRIDGWLAYGDMPGARNFASAFESMAERRLAGHFGEKPAGIEGPASRLGGVPASSGDRSFEIPAFPRLSVMVVLWAASEGFSGSAKMLFPPRAPCYLHSEDLAALGVVLAERLIALDERGGAPGVVVHRNIVHMIELRGIPWH